MSANQDNTIILYDIPSALPNRAWSPNVWKIRLVLNYKKLPYKTEWVPYSEIAEHCKRIGANPTETNVYGNANHYTLPVIYDPTTKRVVTESSVIARYLDEQYPDTPKVVDVAGGFGVLQHTFISSFGPTVLPALSQFSMPKTVEILTPDGIEYFRRTREGYVYKKKLEEVVPKKETGDWDREWKNFEEGLGKVDAWFVSGGQDGKAFVTGDSPTFADFVIGGYLTWVKLIFGEDSREWRDIVSWHGGRWGRLIGGLEPYTAVL
ncbi:hypothetical protein AX16_001532 [Volvariella volvacea WC 439]|nr:hypothetical protein AX16_001532 [Volvariella volvacea WC 439]